MWFYVLFLSERKPLPESGSKIWDLLRIVWVIVSCYISIQLIRLYIFIGWSGVLSLHHQVLLQRSSRSTASLWHHKVSVCVSQRSKHCRDILQFLFSITNVTGNSITNDLLNDLLLVIKSFMIVYERYYGYRIIASIYWQETQ